MKERQVIIGVLRELGRRLWVVRVIRETAFSLCVILFCLVCFQLIEPNFSAGVPAAGTIISVALLAALATVTVEVTRRSARGVSTQQAAAYADARAQLNDELKCAYWFLSETQSSPFVELQVQRAAAAAARLDLAMLAPRTLPIDVVAAAGLGLLLAALIWMTPQMSRPGDSSGEVGPAERRESADLRSFLTDGPHDAQVEKLDLALRTLQRADASAEEKKQALADARDAIDQTNMEASVAREALAKLTEALKSNPQFGAAVQALDQGHIGEAMEQLRKLKADPAAGGPEDPAMEPAGTVSAPESNLNQELENAGRDLTGKNAAVNQDAINRVINALEQANERMEVQRRVNSVKRRMDDNLVAAAQRSQLTASQFDSRTNAPNPTPSPETGNANVRGGALFRQAAIAREEGDSAREGSQAGDASGDSVALPLEGAATRRLDAQLKLEAVLQKNAASEDPDGKGDQEWFYSATRKQKSMLQTQNVQLRAGYDRENATDHDRVPVRQKNIVKNYFLNLHESEKK